MRAIPLGIGAQARRPLAGFVLGVLLQLAAVFALVGPSVWRHPGARGLAWAPMFLLCAGVLVLFPRRALLISPILILIPFRFAAAHAFEWIFLGALTAYLLRKASQSDMRFPLRSVDVAFFLYVVWGVISVTHAVDTKAAVAGLIPLIIFFLAFMAGSWILGSRSASQLLPIYALVAVGVAIEVAFVVSIRAQSLNVLAGRTTWLTNVGWGASNYLAAVSSLVACVGLPVLFLSRGWKRSLAVLAIAAAAAVCLVTISRGGILALSLGLLLAALLVGRRNLGLVLLLLGGVVAAYFFTSVGHLGVARFAQPTELSSVGARLLFFKEAIRIALEHPVFGVGPDQIQFHTYYDTGPNPHNVLLKNAADLGFVGCGLYLFLMGWLLRRWFVLRRRTSEAGERILWLALLLALSVAWFNASYEPTLVGHQYGFLFWLLVGALTAPRPDEAGGSG